MTSQLQNAPPVATGGVRWGALGLAALAGASAWVSLGTMAVINPETMGRAFALPGWWLLAALTFGSAIVARVAKVSMARLWPLALVALLWLPFLPGSIPAVFLIWEGPMEAAVWLAVLVGLVVAAGPAVPPRLQQLVTDPRLAPRLAGGLTLVAAVTVFASVRSVVPGGDEPHYLVITQSLLADADLQIENNHDRGDYLSYFAGRLRPDFMRRGADGQIYSIHAPGLSAIVLPAFALAGYPGAVATVVLLVVVASVLTWTTAWWLSASVAGAWAAWAAVFLTSPFLFHAFAIYPDAPAALVVIAGVGILVRLEALQPVSRARVWVVGAGLSLLPWLHTRFAILAGTIGLCLAARFMTRADRRGLLIALGTVPAFAAAMWFGYFWWIWHTPNPSAPYGPDTGSALAYVGRGLTGLLGDQQFGLISTAPVYGIALLASLALARRIPRLMGELAIIVVPYVLVTASYAMWWGGISAPARFLVSVMPLAALPLAAWWPRQSASGRTFTLVLLFTSLLLVWPRAFVEGGRLLYSDRSGFDLALSWLSPSVDLALAFPSVHRDAALGAVRDGAVWLAAGLLVAAFARAGVGKPAMSMATRWTVVVALSAAGFMAATAVVWASHDRLVVTSSRSQIAALTAVRHLWQPEYMRVRPFRMVSGEEFLRLATFGSTDRSAPRAGEPTLLRAAAVPAGDYEVLLSGPPPVGAVTMVLGRNDAPLEQWSFAAAAPGLAAATVRLPVDVASLTIRGGGESTGASRVTLRPTSVVRAANSAGRKALRAARYGASRVFAFDEQVYLEPTGFWTRANGTAVVVIDRDRTSASDAVPAIVVRAGAVATSIGLSAGDWSARLVLEPGQEQSVTLPPLPAAGPWVLTLQSGAGFRPSAVDAASDDVRRLAAWVTIPQAARP